MACRLLNHSSRHYEDEPVIPGLPYRIRLNGQRFFTAEDFWSIDEFLKSDMASGQYDYCWKNGEIDVYFLFDNPQTAFALKLKFG